MVLSRYRVRVVEEWVQALLVILGIFCDPPFLASMYVVSPWYILPSCLGSLKACLSCLPIHLRYAFDSENASRPKRSCGSCVVMFGMLLGNPQIFLYNLIICLSNFLIVALEKGMA